MNEKQQQLTFDKGMTNTPSDEICSDNALAESINMIYRDSEHHVIQHPRLLLQSQDTGQRRLVFVHKLENGQENFIYEGYTYSYAYQLYFAGSSLTNSAHTSQVGINQIKAIGKTLVVALNDTLTYYLYKDGAYTYIGNNIPAPHMEFGLSGEPGEKVHPAGTADYTYFNYILVGTVAGTSSPDWSIDNRTLYDDSVKGLYAKGRNKAAQQKAFVNPFFVRYALKLYDGTYTHISNPIPLFPNTTNSCFWNSGEFYIHAMYLVYKNYTTYDNWTDIVKNISIFISRGIELCDLSLDAINGSRGEHGENEVARFAIDGVATDSSEVAMHFPFVMYSDSEKEDFLTSESVFYHLCDISATTAVYQFTQLKKHFSHVTLENLETSEQLPYDNYYSLAPMSAAFLYDYNMRLNLAHVKRGFFGGFLSFSGLYTSLSYDYDIYVRIASESGTRVVSRTIQNSREVVGAYFFYPDPRANHVTIYRDRTCIVDADLIEHPGLNGAYYLWKWPDPQDYVPNDFPSPQLNDALVNTSPEELYSYIITSEVNNPFLFKAEGYNRVGTGNVIGMAAQTQAMSQGQFGQYPLLVFTTEGIWAMSVNATGLFDSIKPLSREVALKDNPAITPVDGAVFFVSKKGLMVVTGSNVTCVSQQLDGKTVLLSNGNYFNTQSFLQTAFIAYDYRDSLLWIFNTSIFPQGALVFSMKSGTYAWATFGEQAEGVVNNYPDYLIQTTDKDIYTLYGRYPAASDSTTYAASITSRPLKLENALALKTIMQIKNIHHISGALQWSLQASNDLTHWFEKTSLRGTPWKYYRLHYAFWSLRATDTFAGTVLITQERRTNKLR